MDIANKYLDLYYVFIQDGKKNTKHNQNVLINYLFIRNNSISY